MGGLVDVWNWEGVLGCLGGSGWLGGGGCFWFGRVVCRVFFVGLGFSVGVLRSRRVLQRCAPHSWTGGGWVAECQVRSPLPKSLWPKCLAYSPEIPLPTPESQKSLERVSRECFESLERVSRVLNRVSRVWVRVSPFRRPLSRVPPEHLSPPNIVARVLTILSENFPTIFVSGSQSQWAPNSKNSPQTPSWLVFTPFYKTIRSVFQW